MTRKQIIVKTLLSGIFFAFLLVSCDTERDQEKVSEILSDTLFSEHAEDVEMRYSDSGVMKALIKAPVLDRYPVSEPYTIFEKGVEAFFYTPDGQIENTVKSNYAIRKEKAKTVEMRRDVRLENNKGEKLNTEKLIWDQATSKIYTDAFVKITTPDNIIYGDGLEANQDFSEYKIFNVKGTVSLNDDEKTK